MICVKLLIVCVFAEVLVELNPFVHGSTNDDRIKDAKEVVLAAYFTHSGSEHGQKIGRVQNTLC